MFPDFSTSKASSSGLLWQCQTAGAAAIAFSRLEVELRSSRRRKRYVIKYMIFMNATKNSKDCHQEQLVFPSKWNALDKSFFKIFGSTFTLCQSISKLFVSKWVKRWLMHRSGPRSPIDRFHKRTDPSPMHRAPSKTHLGWLIYINP